MKVKYLGFKFNTGKNIKLEDFLAYMVQFDDTERKFNGKERLFFYLKPDSDDYYKGLFITIKDHKKFCELKQDEDKYKVIVNDIGDDSKLMDFNFFIVNKKSGYGLYQYYHNSTSVHQFTSFCKKFFNELQKDLKDSDIQNLEKPTEKNKKKTRAKYKHVLTSNILVKKENLPQLLNKVKEVKRFEYYISSFSLVEDLYVPSKNQVEKVYQRIYYGENTLIEQIRSGIIDAVDKYGVSKGKIRGKDDDGKELIFEIYNTPDYFGEENFDLLVAKLIDQDIYDLNNNPIINNLLSLAKNNSMIFEIKE